MKLFSLLSLFATASAASKVTLFPGAGYARSAYPLVDEIKEKIKQNGELCVAHSHDGAANLQAALSGQVGRCDLAVVFLGAVPTPEQLSSFKAPVLVVGGSLDGVARISRFAVAQHMHTHYSTGGNVRFALLEGASHHSFAHGEPTALVRSLDINPAVSNEEVHPQVVSMVQELVGGGSDTFITAAEQFGAQLAAPVIAALQMEGSTQLGHPSCNSDFPTNPTCQYPKWPDHSLPPGPAKPPNPLPPSDCVCGSPWVEQFANPMIAGFSQSMRPTGKVSTKDSFHDVSDTHPFHLPHIFNSCADSDPSCDLNSTTVTMPILKAGDLWPNASSAPLSAFEMRTKLKSRQAVWEAAGLGHFDSGKTDKNMSMCKDVNQAAYNWALAKADPAVRANFLKNGEPFVMVDDKPATIGITGPEWIKDEMVYTRVNNQIQIQSWQFVVDNTNSGKVPWFFPVGMHYCKLLSPARAMEWIYTDGLRATMAIP